MNSSSDDHLKRELAHDVNNITYKMILCLKNLSIQNPEIEEAKSFQILEKGMDDISMIMKNLVELDPEPFLDYLKLRK